MTRIISKEIKTNEYPGLIIGGDTDKDYLARACGFMSHHDISTSKIKIEHEENEYLMEIIHYPMGEQKFLEQDDFIDLIDQANNCEITQEESVRELFQLVNNQEIEFRENCWYEACITIKKGEEEILSDYESNMGLEGVKGSIQEILDEYNNNNTLIEIFDWLLEEYQ